MLEIKNLDKKINDKIVLENINMKFERGIIYGIVGHNGSSKTMLLNVISGNLKEDNGEIIVDAKTKVAGCIGKFNLIETMTVMENLLEFENSKNKIKEILKKLGILNFAEFKISKLSLGTKQKVWIATLFLRDPDIYILDEPFNALDENSKKNLKNMLLEEKEKNKCILLVSHNEEDINDLCEKIYELENGKLIREEENTNVIKEKYDVKLSDEIVDKDKYIFIKKHYKLMIIILFCLSIFLYVVSTEKTLDSAEKLSASGKYLDAYTMSYGIKRLPGNKKITKIRLRNNIHLDYKEGEKSAPFIALKLAKDYKQVFGVGEVEKILDGYILKYTNEILNTADYTEEGIEKIIKLEIEDIKKLLNH